MLSPRSSKPHDLSLPSLSPGLIPRCLSKILQCSEQMRAAGAGERFSALKFNQKWGLNMFNGGE